MNKEKLILYAILLLAVIVGGVIGYRAVQNNRYTPMQMGNITMLWDNWNNEPVFKEGEAKKIYDLMYKNQGE